MLDYSEGHPQIQLDCQGQLFFVVVVLCIYRIRCAVALGHQLTRALMRFLTKQFTRGAWPRPGRSPLATHAQPEFQESVSFSWSKQMEGPGEACGLVVDGEELISSLTAVFDQLRFVLS